MQCFSFRSSYPSSPLFIEQIEQCDGVVPENSELEVEVLLSERDYLRTLCQTVPMLPSDSLQPLISYLYRNSTFSECFIAMLAKNQRRLYSILLKEIESDLKAGQTERISNCVFVFSTMAETEFSELMGVLFSDDSLHWFGLSCIVIHENQESLIVALVDLMQQLPDEPSNSAKIRNLVTRVRTSVITDTKNKINPHLVQLLDTLNSLFASRIQVSTQKSRAESIQGIQGVQPEKQIMQQIQEMIQEVNFINRDTLSSELPKIPKRIQQYYLFRRAWFSEKIIKTVLRMKVVS